MINWNLLTEIGNIVVTGALALIIAVWFLLEARWKLAWEWCLVFGGGMFVVLLTKFAFVGWGIGSETLDFTGLSGHAMRAMCGLPVLGFLLFYHAHSRLRQLALLAMLLLAGLISYSRLVVHAHSVSEVLSGAGFGLLLGAVFMRRVGLAQRFRFNQALVLVSLLGLLLSHRAAPVATQNMLIELTLKITHHPRPFTRLGWHFDPYYCVEPEPGKTTFCRHYP